MVTVEIDSDFIPIPDQKLVFGSDKKLNSVPSTRRSGKTSGIIYFSNVWALAGQEVAIVQPDYGYCAEMYESLVSGMADCVAMVSKQRLTIRTITGGRIRFYSYEAFEKLRGKKFHKVLFDEFQFFYYDLDILMAVLLPTIADYNGQVWFFGTPKKNTAIEAITLNKGDEWGHWTMRATNNPYIRPEEIITQKKILSPLVYAQEWEAQFVDFSGQLWLYELKPDVHIIEDIPIDEYAPITLCWDFNVDPCTCIFKQTIRDKAENGGGINFFMELTADGGTHHLAQMVRRYLDSLTFFKGAYFVTGDSSGSKSDTRGNTTDYEIISRTLGIPFSRFIDTRKQNPMLDYSRDLCNTAFFHNLVFVDKNKCPILARDISIAKPKEGSSQLIKDRATNKMDSFDAMRYGIHAEFKSIKDILRFSSLVNGNNG